MFLSLAGIIKKTRLRVARLPSSACQVKSLNIMAAVCPSCSCISISAVAKLVRNAAIFSFETSNAVGRI